jgi:PKD repeat protein
MNRNLYLSLFLLIAVTACSGLIPPAAAATTELHIVKYADDRTSVIKETTVTWQWMRDNLPVLGDGTTHYYHQGPVFIDNASLAIQEELRWNPGEDMNVQEKDYGAVQGTNLKDLCNLVGGLSPGEEVTLKAVDGFTKKFAYRNVYEYPSRQGPMVITWRRDGSTPDTAYDEAMKLVFFADTTGNPWGIHALGNYDWHESADSPYWYYYYQGAGNKYPTTTGLSVKYISEIIIYSSTPASDIQPPVAEFSANTVSGTVPLTVQFTDLSTNSPTSWAWDFTNDGAVDSTVQNPSFTYATAGTYTVKLTSTNSYGNTSKTRSDYIAVSTPPGSAPAAAFSATPRSGTVPLTVQFTDLSTNSPTSWKWDFTNDGAVDSTDQNPSYTYTTTGTYTVKLTSTNSYGSTNETKSGYITISAPTGTPPAAAFSATPQSGTSSATTVIGSAPLTVQFTDLSTNSPTSWAWDFTTDGMIDSSDQNPQYTFSGPGIYTVNLTVSSPYGSSSAVKAQYIRVTKAQSAEVTVSQTTVQVPAAVTTARATVTVSLQPATIKKTNTPVMTTPPAESAPSAESPGPEPAIIVGTLMVGGLITVLVRNNRYAK